METKKIKKNNKTSISKEARLEDLIIRKPRNSDDLPWDEFVEFLQDFKGRTIETENSFLTIDAKDDAIYIRR